MSSIGKYYWNRRETAFIYFSIKPRDAATACFLYGPKAEFTLDAARRGAS